jgi:short-subunit dehydrogenase
MQQESGLQNNRVVILGGSSGIGLAVAELDINICIGLILWFEAY